MRRKKIINSSKFTPPCQSCTLIFRLVTNVLKVWYRAAVPAGLYLVVLSLKFVLLSSRNAAFTITGCCSFLLYFISFIIQLVSEDYVVSGKKAYPNIHVVILFSHQLREKIHSLLIPKGLSIR